MTRLLLCAFSFVILASTSASAKVIGTDQMVPINGVGMNVPSLMNTIVKAVGLMNPMGCTGTHIGAGLVITAAHCFNGNGTPRILENQACPDVTIQWGVRGNRLGAISRCVRIVAMQLNDHYDWAVFQIDRAPQEFVQVDTTSTFQLNHPVTIFSHADTEPLRWSRSCRLVSPLTSQFSRKSLYHLCDTNPGSSGAAIIDARTLKVIGIHDGGDERVNYGTYLKSIPFQQVLLRNRVRLPAWR